MRAARVVLILVIALLLVGAAAVWQRNRQAATAASLEGILDETLRAGTAEPVEARGRTRVLVGSAWQDSPMGLRQAGGRALISLGQRPGAVELLDDGERLWRLEASPTVLGPSSRRIDWSLLRRNYELRRAPTRTLAGLEATGVRLVNRRTRRVAEDFWVCVPLRLVLARRSYDADGHLVSETEIAEALEWPPTPVTPALDAAVGRLPKPAPDESLTDSEFADRAGFSPLRPAYVPSGYQEIGLFAHTCPHGRTYAEVRYYDGLRVLSVFERPGGGPGGGGGGLGQGRGWRHGQGRDMESSEPSLVDEGQAKTVRVRRGGHRIFVTGDLTQEEILRVVNSMP
jgi:hypothetical protein